MAERTLEPCIRSHVANLGLLESAKRDMINTQYISTRRRCPMSNLVVKKHSISFELAQKMVNAVVAKARELGVTENVAILDDGGNLKAFSRMDGTSIPTIEIAQNKAYTALFRCLHAGLFQFYPRRPVAFGRSAHAGACGGMGWRISHQGGRRNCRGDWCERGANGAERRRLRESSVSARIRWTGSRLMLSLYRRPNCGRHTRLICLLTSTRERDDYT